MITDIGGRGYAPTITLIIKQVRTDSGAGLAPSSRRHRPQTVRRL